MNNSQQRFYPGDRVRIREDSEEFEIERPDQTFLTGTKGSIGIIVSPEEFWGDYMKRIQQAESFISEELENPVNIHESLLSKEHEQFMIAGVKSSMEAHFRYPVKFETVEPAAAPEAVICCKVGECQLVYVSKHISTGVVEILEKIGVTAKCPKCGRDANCSYDGERGRGTDYCDYYSLRCPHCGHKEKKEQWINLTIHTDGLSHCPYCGKSNRAHRDP